MFVPATAFVKNVPSRQFPAQGCATVFGTWVPFLSNATMLSFVAMTTWNGPAAIVGSGGILQHSFIPRKPPPNTGASAGAEVEFAFSESSSDDACARGGSWRLALDEAPRFGAEGVPCPRRSGAVSYRGCAFSLPLPGTTPRTSA